MEQFLAKNANGVLSAFVHSVFTVREHSVWVKVNNISNKN